MFADVSKEALPKRRIWVNIEFLVFVKELSISLTVLKRVRLWLVNKGQQRKKCVFDSTSRPQEQNGFRVSWKLCQNLCSRKWLRARRSLVSYLISLQLWQLNTLFGDDLINFNKLFLKTLRIAALGRLGSNLFHSITVDEKKFLKKLCLVWNGVILSVFLVL